MTAPKGGGPGQQRRDARKAHGQPQSPLAAELDDPQDGDLLSLQNLSKHLGAYNHEGCNRPGVWASTLGASLMGCALRSSASRAACLAWRRMCRKGSCRPSIAFPLLRDVAEAGPVPSREGRIRVAETCVGQKC